MFQTDWPWDPQENGKLDALGPRFTAGTGVSTTNIPAQCPYQQLPGLLRHDSAVEPPHIQLHPAHAGSSG